MQCASNYTSVAENSLLYHLSTKEALGKVNNAFLSYSAVVQGRYKLPTYSDLCFSSASYCL
jgi:hypothetical protein